MARRAWIADDGAGLARKKNSRKLVRLWPDAGRLLGLSRYTCYAAAKSGQLPVLRLGSMLYMAPGVLDRMLEEGWQPDAERQLVRTSKNVASDA
jgi:hypothetical protein